MPNLKQHQETGAIVGGLAGALLNIFKQVDEINKGIRKEVDVSEITVHTGIGGLCGLAGGMLPDILEPAYHPNHRDFFHSWTVLGTVFFSSVKILDSNEIEHLYKVGGASLSFGYIAHLFQDSQTPKGLKLI